MADVRVKPGDVLGGKYCVERVLGAGGMGIVVAARHVDLGQRVALKFMLEEAMKDPSHAERFLREAKAAVQLKSSHTTQVLDVGRLQNGEPFMVMEYLEGRDLDEELHARGPVSPQVAVDYILQASEALAEAHSVGLIHRDVKLKNLFLTRTLDGRPLVKVLDFGLAKTLGTNDVSLTATNSVFGSPQYMSPEQMRSAKDVDYRSDIWSLGVCLYELLTGRVPFDAPGVAEICAMVLKDAVPPPSQFALGLPVDLEAVILKCLEKDPRRRYQSIAELAIALQDYAADDGSARRILTVMRNAQKNELPTIVAPSQPHAIAAGPMTIHAWDSAALPELSSRRAASRNQVLLMISATFVILASVIVIALVLRGRRAHAQQAVATPPVFEPLESPSPPPAAPAPPPRSGIALAPSDSAAPAAPLAVTGEAPPPHVAAGADEPSAKRPPPARPSAPAHPTAKAPPAASSKPAAKPKNAPGAGSEYM